MVYAVILDRGIIQRAVGFIEETYNHCYLLQTLASGLLEHPALYVFHIATACNRSCHSIPVHTRSPPRVSGSFLDTMLQGSKHNASKIAVPQLRSSKPKTNTPFNSKAREVLEKAWSRLIYGKHLSELNRSTMAQSTGKLFGFTREIHAIFMEHQDQGEAITYILDKLMTGSNELENAIMRRFKKTRLGIQEPIEGLDYAEAVRQLFIDCAGVGLDNRTKAKGMQIWRLIASAAPGGKGLWNYGDAEHKVKCEKERLRSAFSEVPDTRQGVEMYLKCIINKSGLPMPMFTALLSIWR